MALLLQMTFISLGQAQAIVDAATGIFEYDKNRLDYTDLNRELDNIENYLKGGRVTSDDLNYYIKALITSKNELSEIKKEIDKDIGFVQRRIDALGDAPENIELEINTISKRRSEFNQELAVNKARLAEVDIMLAKIVELDSMIANTKSKELLGKLLDRHTSILNPYNFFYSTKLFIGFVFDVIKSPVVWYKSLNLEQKSYVNSNIVPVFLVIILSFVVGLYLRLVIMRKFGYKQDIVQPRYITKVFAAFFVAIAYGAIPASIVAGFILWMKSTEVLTIGFFGLVVNSFLNYFLFIFIATAFSRVIFAPYNGKWRLVDVNDDKARKVKSSLYLSIILIGISSLLEGIASNASYPIELISYINVLSSAIKVFSFFIVSKAMFWGDAISSFEERSSEEGSDEELSEEDITKEKSSRIVFLLLLISIGFFTISLFGYPQLSSFMLNRFLMSFIIIGLFVIVRKAVIEVLHRLLLLVFWTRNFKLQRRLIYKIDFWLVLLVDMLLSCVAAFGLLSLWGASKASLVDWIKKLLFGFNVGGIEISVLAIALAIAVFTITIAVVRMLKRRLMSNILSKMDIDDGIKHSLASGFGFVGFILAAIFAITVLGGNLTNLALIAGALSFGIGLGLQNIVNNFVSGIILLFERPVKVGDWVIINNYEGLVRQVNIRATEVQIWNGSTVIIPNADFLSNSVINYTLRDRQGRIEIAVSVAYGSDVEKIKEILLEVAAKHRRVLKKPDPYVVFMSFGNTSLDFELRCFTGDIMNRLSISSDLRYAIDTRFREENIALAIPQIIYRSPTEIFKNETVV